GSCGRISASCTSRQSPPRAALTPPAVRVRGDAAQGGHARRLYLLNDGGKRIDELATAFERGSQGCVGSISDRRSKFDPLALRPNQRKFTHYQGYHRQRLAFFWPAFCTPKSCRQGCRDVLHPRWSSEVLAADPGARLS